jgi:hypothetical protein
MKLYCKYFLMLLFLASPASAQDKSGFKIARLKYGGGGDWYNDPSGEVNLLKFVAANTNIRTEPVYEFVDLSGGNIFAYPFLFMTGHGNIVFSDSDAAKLRAYLENGGFLYVDDDYGLDKAFRREIKKVFPVSGSLRVKDFLFFILTKATRVTAGPIPKYTKILPASARKH